MAFVLAFVILAFCVTGCSAETKNHFYSFLNMPIKDANLFDILMLLVTASFIGSFFK